MAYFMEDRMENILKYKPDESYVLLSFHLAKQKSSRGICSTEGA